MSEPLFTRSGRETSLVEEMIEEKEVDMMIVMAASVVFSFVSMHWCVLSWVASGLFKIIQWGKRTIAGWFPGLTKRAKNEKYTHMLKNIENIFNFLRLGTFIFKQNTAKKKKICNTCLHLKVFFHPHWIFFTVCFSLLTLILLIHEVFYMGMHFLLLSCKN